jgi:hypothetical protein
MVNVVERVEGCNLSYQVLGSGPKALLRRFAIRPNALRHRDLHSGLHVRSIRAVNPVGPLGTKCAIKLENYP